MFRNTKLKELNIRNALLLITYTIVLIAAFLHIEQIFVFLLHIFSLLKPFVYGFVLAYIFNIPMTFFLKKLPTTVKKGRKIIASCLSLLVIAIILIFIINIVVPQFIASIQSFITAFPEYVSQTQELVLKYVNEYSLNDEVMKQISLYSKEIQVYLSEFLKNLLPALIDATMGITSSIANVFMAIVIAVYLTVSKNTLMSQMNRVSIAFVPEKKLDVLKHICVLAHRTFTNFISGQLIEAVIIGVLCYIGCLILKIPYAPIISVIIGCTNIVPIFGPIIGTAICGILIVFVSPIQAIIFVIFGIALQQFESNLIYPKVVGTSVGLSGLWVLFAISIGGGLFGLIGMILGLPCFAVLYTLLKEATQRRLEAKKTVIIEKS